MKLHLRAFHHQQSTKMPRFYPESDCNLYVERLVDCYHTDEAQHVLRRNILKNPVCWFRDQDHPDPNRSVICSWGIGRNFEENTGWKSENFIKSRIRKDSKLPVAGRRGFWRISRQSPCGTRNLPLHTWKLGDWLKQSSFRKSNTSDENSKSSSNLNVTAKSHH